LESEKLKTEGAGEELEQNYRTAMLTVAGFIALTILLVIVAFLATQAITRPGDAWLVGALRIAILVFGLGAVVLRRTKFARMRLQDIAGVRGAAGLLRSLRRSTIELASIGGAAALMGFVATILSGDPFEMLRAGVVALAVLLYAFPRKGAWRRLIEGFERQGVMDATTKGTLA